MSLASIGVNCVTLANNLALDFGADALMDTLDQERCAAVGSSVQPQDDRHSFDPRP